MAGTIRSTIVAGKATDVAEPVEHRRRGRVQADASTNSCTTPASAAPLPAMLSQDTTSTGAPPGPEPGRETGGEPSDDRDEVRVVRRGRGEVGADAGRRGVQPAVRAPRSSPSR